MDKHFVTRVKTTPQATVTFFSWQGLPRTPVLRSWSTGPHLWPGLFNYRYLSPFTPILPLFKPKVLSVPRRWAKVLFRHASQHINKSLCSSSLLIFLIGIWSWVAGPNILKPLELASGLELQLYKETPSPSSLPLCLQTHTGDQSLLICL
jgi:hypothetical protein